MGLVLSIETDEAVMVCIKMKNIAAGVIPEVGHGAGCGRVG
jgi:hypothetical protein